MPRLLNPFRRRRIFAVVVWRSDTGTMTETVIEAADAATARDLGEHQLLGCDPAAFSPGYEVTVIETVRGGPRP
ncbi:hypothetical protein ACFOGJ_24040 [Marinibaculum pumilum]|uniref:Uncharacterized protein n=1 Tax=Marinibaculum pumilum TaxID=1766165 RepID=A0ABV7L6U8_9PROT